MEVDVLKETVNELSQSAKLIRDLVADLIKLRRSLLKAYSGLSKLIEEPEILKPTVPVPQPPTRFQAPQLQEQQVKVESPVPPIPPTMTPSITPPPALTQKAAIEGEMVAFLKALSESIKSDPRVSNVVLKLGEFKEKVEKKYVYHPVLSEIKLVISKFQSVPGDNVLSGGEVEEVLKRLSNWASRLS